MSKRKKAMVSVEQGTISNGKKKRTVTFDEENIDATELSQVATNDTDSKINKRRIAQREVAERRAAHFARADSKVDVSTTISAVSSSSSSLRNSTPTGSLKLRKNNVANESESWPGPFATAHAIMAKRSEAKQAREEAIKAAKNKNELSNNSNFEGEDGDDDQRDIYEVPVGSLSWTPSTISDRQSVSSVPTLMDLCIDFIVSQFDENGSNGTESSVQFLSGDVREKLMLQLLRRRKLTATNSLGFAIPQSDSLCYPDCSIMTEEDLIAAVAKVCGAADNGNADYCSTTTIPTSELREVRLLNCGRGFTDRTAAILTPYCQSLDTLVLTGCYKLNDKALSSLIINGCGGKLTSLDLSCNLRLGATALSVIGSVPNLVSLMLNNVTHLTDNEALQTMISLRHLSLSGMIEITDSSIQRILLSCGPQLQSLNISGCLQLTDRTIEAIRTVCSNLQSIDVSQLPEVSTAALIGLFIANPSTLDQEAAREPEISCSNAGSRDEEEEGEEYGRAPVSSSSSSSVYAPPPSIGRLSYVNLQGNVNTTDEVIVHLSEMSRSTLRHLDINGCNRLTNMAAVALRMNCSSTMEHLDISFVRGFAEDAVGALVDSCTILQTLHVWVSNRRC
eukprot:gene29687-38816_t